MNNQFWEWCVRSRQSAYAANENFNGPDSLSAGPCWCFQRMGQAQVVLPDGREVYIAGEHEDHYDPDFFIYNDVVIIDNNKNVTIFGYPESDFPPTDFHTATVVDQDILIIGNLGYPADRVSGQTQVFRLETENWRMAPVQTTGYPPGWIHDHAAALSEDKTAIVLTGGKLCGERILENIDDFKLCLTNLEWSKTTDRKWERWILERSDGECNNLWEIRTACWNRESGGLLEKERDKFSSSLPPEVAAELVRPEVSEDQMDAISTLYQSPFDNDQQASEDAGNYGVYKMDVDGTTVRFNEDMYGVLVTIEGQLPSEAVDTILSQLRRRLSSLEKTSYAVTQLDA